MGPNCAPNLMRHNAMADRAQNHSRTGGCQFGGVRYELRAPPLKIYSRSFGISVIVRATAFALTRGSPQRWCRPTDSGRTLNCYFCPNCGSRVWHGEAARDATLSTRAARLMSPSM